jgi:hypothetical protein
MSNYFEQSSSTPSTPFRFHTSGRKGIDQVATLQRDLANQRYLEYTIRPYQATADKATLNFAAEHRIMFQGMPGGGTPGDKIQTETRLIFPRMSEQFVNSRLDPAHRPFVAVPYLGNGRCNVTREFQMLKGIRNPTDEELLEMDNNVLLATATHSFQPKGAPSLKIPEMPKEWVRGGDISVKRAPYSSAPLAK